MFKAVVTGATGFIGSALCKELLQEGVTVLGIGRNQDILNKLEENKRFKGISLDFSQYDLIDRRIKDRDFDCFFHLANYGVNGADKGNYRVQLTNTMIACDMVGIANILGCKRFVFVGSVDEFESCYRPDASYIQPTHSRIYGTAKYSAECIGKVVSENLGMEYVTALLSLTYGEGNRTNILPNVMIKNSMSGKPINLIAGNNTFDLIYIKEAVQALLAIAQNGKNMESYFVGHEDLRTFKKIVEEINRYLDNPVELNFGKYKDRGIPIEYGDIDRTKLFRDAGYRCDVSIKEGIEKTKAWIKETYDI